MLHPLARSVCIASQDLPAVSSAVRQQLLDLGWVSVQWEVYADPRNAWAPLLQVPLRQVMLHWGPYSTLRRGRSKMSLSFKYLATAPGVKLREGKTEETGLPLMN